MTDPIRLQVGIAMPPLTLPARTAGPDRLAGSLSRLGRLACVLAALALPALGLAVADAVHRAGAPKAAAPLGGGAAIRADAIRVATLGATRDGGRP